MLQKYMAAVDDFVKNKCGEEDEARYDRGLSYVKKKSRKELRKEKRKLKKARMKGSYEGNKSLTLPSGDGEKTEGTEPQVQKKKKKKIGNVDQQESHMTKTASAEKAVKTKTPQPSEKRQKVDRLQQSRKMALLEANEEEEREIKKLERCLGLNKRKNKKNIPQSFVADGLDYILGLLDSGSSAGAVFHDDHMDMDVAKEKFEKLGEEDSQLSDEHDGAGEEDAGEDSDEDNDENIASMDDDDDDDEEEEEEEMVDEGEEPGEEQETAIPDSRTASKVDSVSSVFLRSLRTCHRDR